MTAFRAVGAAAEVGVAITVGPVEEAQVGRMADPEAQALPIGVATLVVHVV